MSKDSLKFLGLLGVFFGSIGAIVGAVVNHKIDRKCESKAIEMWKTMALSFKELLIDSYEKNDKLKTKIKSMEK